MNPIEINSAHFDCQFGAAGDMLLGALLDSGFIEQQRFLSELNKLALPEGSFEIKIEGVERSGIRCTKFDVINHESDLAGVGAGEPPALRPFDSHGGELAGDHPVGSHHRHLSDILRIIEGSEISSRAKDLAARIFKRLGRAEARVHGVPIEDIHFHEVGAVDAIIDIVGFAIAFDLLGIEYVSCSAIPLGGGVVKTAHGLLPVPAPAVVNLLAEVKAPAASEPQIPFECLTPTAAAILSEIVSSWDKAVPFSQMHGSGFGAGSKNPEGWPNSVRVILGTSVTHSALSGSPNETAEHPFETETVSIVDANIDDQSPQALSFAVESIFAAGALDVLVIPAMMKKGRSGFLLSVLCRPQDEGKMQSLILQHTSSIGCRSYRSKRVFAARYFREALMPDGTKVRIKVGSDKTGQIVNVLPEFDDIAAYARRNSLSIKEASDRALLAFYKNGKNAEPVNAGPKNGDGHD